MFRLLVGCEQGVVQAGYLQFEKVLAGLRGEINEEVDDNVPRFSELQQHRHFSFRRRLTRSERM